MTTKIGLVINNEEEKNAYDLVKKMTWFFDWCMSKILLQIWHFTPYIYKTQASLEEGMLYTNYHR